MNIFDNSKAGTENGHYLSQWCEAVQVGDKVITGLNIHHICTYRSIDNDYLEISVTRFDDKTIDKRMKPFSYVKHKGFWNIFKELV